MTGNFFLDWALMAVSLANVILITWLGLIVLLNAERRRWGVWLVGGGFLMGGAFFVSHSAILGLGPDFVSRGLDIWWRAGWAPLVGLPLAWYLLILWYAGAWDDWISATASNRLLPANPLRHRHQIWLLVIGILFMGLVGLLLFTSPLPSFMHAAQLQLATPVAIGGLPILLVIFPVYIILCIGLSLDALRHPMPSGRMMGDQARRRAHPWLMAAANLLLIVSLLVGAIIGWIVWQAETTLPSPAYTLVSGAVAWFDLLIALLIGIAVVMVGQAIVAYEIFTGHTLPRGELRRYWFNAIVLALGFGMVVGFSFAWQTHQIYSLLLATLLMTLFYALLSWRSYTRREEYIRQLRPFLGSQHLYERLLNMPTHTVATQSAGRVGEPGGQGLPPPELDIAAPFQTLCTEVLGVRLAFLVALGPLSPLVGPPLAYPATTSTAMPWLAELTAGLRTPQLTCLPLDPAQTNGLLWAVPLWSERGLIGLFLLGAKRDNGLYTQEDIEIARASGERLIDTRASAEIARSLMTLQRQRLTESQLLDRRTRRVLHDDILPQLHTALLTLDGAAQPEVTTLLIDAHRRIAELLREMPARNAPAAVSMGLVGALRHLLADELPTAFDEVVWQIEPAGAERVQTLPALTVEVLFYAVREVIRNAARYGRGADVNRPLHLHITIQSQSDLMLQIEDDGVGLESATSVSQSSRQGLALHSALLAVVGGTLDVASVAGAGTRVTLRLP